MSLTDTNNKTQQNSTKGNIMDYAQVYEFLPQNPNPSMEIYVKLLSAGLQPEWGPHRTDKNGFLITTILLPINQVPALRDLQKVNPKIYGNPTSNIPNPGLYLYNNGFKPALCQVTETHVQFHIDYPGIKHNDVPTTATFTPLTLENVPVLERALTITYQNTPIVTINLPDSQHIPTTILDDYAKEYAINRKHLSYAVTPYIPLPTTTPE